MSDYHLENGEDVPAGPDGKLASQIEAVADDLVGFEDGLAAQMHRQAAQLRHLDVYHCPTTTAGDVCPGCLP